MGLSTVESMGFDWEVKSAKPPKADGAAVFGTEYLNKEMTQVWIDKEDYTLAPVAAKKRLLLVRKDKYQDVRDELRKTFINCLVLWVEDYIFKTLKVDVQTQLNCLFKENYLVLPIKEGSSKKLFSREGFVYRESKFHKKSEQCGIIDLFLGGNALSKEKIRYVLGIYSNCNYTDILRLIDHHDKYRLAGLARDLERVNTKLHDSVALATLEEAMQL